MSTNIGDDIRRMVPEGYRYLFIQTVDNPSVIGDDCYLTWETETVCGLSCRAALLQCAILCVSFDPATHENIWKACAQQCLIIWNA